MNTYQANPHSSILWSAWRQDPRSWSAVIVRLRQAVMRPRLRCVHAFRDRQWLISLFFFGFRVLKAHRLCTSSFRDMLDFLEVESHQSHYESLNSWWKLMSVWVLRSDTRGLWSVSTEIDFFTIYFQDRSHAHVSARAPFSICAYLVLVGVNARDMNETGRQEMSGWSWRITPARPKDEASAASLVSSVGSYRSSTGDRVRSDLICSNTFCVWLPHVHISSLCEEGFWCYLSCWLGACKTCLVGSPSQEIFSLPLRSEVEVGLQLFVAFQDLPQFHWSL